MSKKKYLIVKKSSLLFIAISGLLYLSFTLIINDGYYYQDKFSFGADSSTYYRLALTYGFDSLQLITMRMNLLGPFFVMFITQFNNQSVFILNLILLSLSYSLIVKNYHINRLGFIALLIMNPMIFSSVMLVNKEIFGLFSVGLFACYVSNERKKYLIFAIIFALMTRWQQSFVMIVYILMDSKINPIKKNRNLSLFLLVIILSILYPLFLSPILGTISDQSTMSKQSETAGGLISILNTLQDHYLFFLVVIPKMISNTFGNLGRISGYIFAPDSIDMYDIYNSFIVLGHQYAMFAVVAFLYMKKKISLKSNLIYFSIIYLVIYSLGIMIQYRYIFPIYIMLALELVKCEKPNLLKYTE